MKRAVFLWVIITTASLLMGGNELPPYTEFIESMRERKEAGEFSSVHQRIEEYLNEYPQLDKDRVRELQTIVDIMERIDFDFSLTREELLDTLDNEIELFEPEELEQWKEKGLIQSKVIDDTTYFFRKTIPNIFFRSREIRARRKTPASELPLALVESSQEVISAYKNEYNYYHLPITRVIRLTNTIDKELETADSMEVWQPFPLELPYQSSIEFFEYSPGLQYSAPTSNPVRNLYFTRRFWNSGEESFSATYRLIQRARYKKVDSERIEPLPDPKPAIAFYLEEKMPHIQYEEPIRNTVDEIVEDENNPYYMARRIYDWFEDEIIFSYSPDYATIDNLSRQVYDDGYGDSVQISLLFMTMCRYAGIPARWQGGWLIYSEYKEPHAWVELFLPPYGWLPVDPSVPAIFNATSHPEVSSDDIVTAIDFYFGSMDRHRLVFSRSFDYTLYPSKSGKRTDPVAFFEGEIEVNEKPLFFDEYDFSVEILAEEK